MVNLTIRLSKGGSNSGSKAEQSLVEADETSLPPHLVDADLPVVKGIGFLYPETCRINFVGVKAQRKPGEKVHICLMCNFPIAIYGRMDPCQHVLCFACAKCDPRCFVCKERVARIQKVDVLESLFICGVPGCLHSFLVRSDFEFHVANDHSQLQQPGSIKAGVSIGKPGDSQIQSQHTDLMLPARNSCANLQVINPRQGDSQRNKDERTQEKRNSWESRQGQYGKDQSHEGHWKYRDRGGEYTYQSSKKRERDREPRGGHPLSSFQSSSKHLQKPGASLPTPSPCPSSNYLPAFPPLHEPSADYPVCPEHPREFYSGRGMPHRAEHLDSSVRLQHAGPSIGSQQGEWQLIPQSAGLGTSGCSRAPPDSFGNMANPLRPMQPQPDGINSLMSTQFGHPMGMPPITMSRFHEGQCLPRPPAGPPSSRAAFKENIVKWHSSPYDRPKLGGADCRLWLGS